MPGLTQQKRFALEWIDEQSHRFSDWHLKIWEYAEPAWREYKSAKAYCDLLRSEGFTIEEGSGGMPTAFAATWGKGRPVLGSYAEYDAVPGNSQRVVIGIGGRLTTPPLPHHLAYGSRTSAVRSG